MTTIKCESQRQYEIRMIKRQIVRWFLKQIPKAHRDIRYTFVGKRLKFKQDLWLERSNTKTEVNKEI